MLSQHLLCGVEIGTIGKRGRQAPVIDLRDIHCGIPGGPQGRCPDRVTDLARQRVHLVAEQRARIRIGAEVVVAAGTAELELGPPQQMMTIGSERVLARPDLADYFEPGVVAMGMDDNQPATRRQSPCYRRQYALRLELDRRARPVRL